MKSILLVKKLLGLAEMTFGLVTASFSLTEGQAVKMIFFARCLITRPQGDLALSGPSLFCKIPM